MEKKIKETEPQFDDAINLQEYIIEKANDMTPVSAIVGIEGALKCIFGALISSNSATLAQCEKAVEAVMDDVLTYAREVAAGKGGRAMQGIKKTNRKKHEIQIN